MKVDSGESLNSGGEGGIALRELALRARFSQSLKDALANADSNRVT